MQLSARTSCFHSDVDFLGLSTHTHLGALERQAEGAVPEELREGAGGARDAEEHGVVVVPASGVSKQVSQGSSRVPAGLQQGLEARQ